jgi:hypothetical protein
LKSKIANNHRSELPFNLETDLERAIAADPDWLAGVKWGQPRPGHPEGKVIFHIRDVLNNIDHFFSNSGDRSRLRLIALIHDTFKYKRDHAQPGVPKKSHGYWARQFAERYINDAGVLEVIELHDEAYKASLLLTRYTNREAAERCARELIRRLGHSLDLFMCFYLCDSRTSDKSTTHYEWFKGLVEEQAKGR